MNGSNQFKIMEYQHQLRWDGASDVSVSFRSLNCL